MRTESEVLGVAGIGSKHLPMIPPKRCFSTTLISACAPWEHRRCVSRTPAALRDPSALPNKPSPAASARPGPSNKKGGERPGFKMFCLLSCSCALQLLAQLEPREIRRCTVTRAPVLVRNRHPFIR
jgi:hypothetical protein